MANETHEPRALSAALAAPPFATRGGGVALHAANRHVERWAPESTASSVRPMRSLSFVDRLVAPWIETAQRSASMRMFGQYTRGTTNEREGAAVSWVFPRPWYQDELDWMAAARQVNTTVAQSAAPSPTMFTTRGTFVAPRPPIAAPATALPSALYEYVAPSLSIAQQGTPTSIAGIGYGGTTDPRRAHDAYSSLVPLAAVQAAELMSRAVAPLMGTRASPGAPTTTMGRVSPALRTVLTTMLERATFARTDAGAAQRAPELVTPPAPRGSDLVSDSATAEVASPATQLANHYAEQRGQIAEVQRIARVTAERELAIRAETRAHEATAAAAQAASAPRADEARAQRTEADVRQRTAQVQEAQRAAQTAAEVERARIEERVAARLAERTAATTGAQRLHEQARAEAALHARTPVEPSTIAPATQTQTQTERRDADRAPAEVSAAIAALPPELAHILAQRPERGMAAIAALSDVLRTAELMARSTAANHTFEVTRGPRLMMPAGLGALVSAVDHAHVIADRPSQLSAPQAPQAPATATAPARPELAWTARPELRMPNLPWLARPAPADRRTTIASTTALGATASASPAALAHVAWADRWLARFAGATPRSLDILQAGAAASPAQRLQALAAAAPESIFVHPMFDAATVSSAETSASETSTSSVGITPAQRTPTLRPTPLPIERFDDSAETPDDVFAQIAAAAAGVRAASAAGPAIAASATAAPDSPAPMVPDRARMSPADLVSHAAPSAPGAGLSAQLAASPFAPALRHVLPLPAASSFDVRALFGGGLAATYLAGLLASSSQELTVPGSAAPTSGAPAWATTGLAAEAFQPAALAAADRAAPEWDATYVAPEVATGSSEVDTTGVTTRSGEAAPSAELTARPDLATSAPSIAASYVAPLTTLRTALLSWQADPAAPSQAMGDSPTVATSQSAPMAGSSARAMIEAMSLPLLGGPIPSQELGSSWGSPGMVADRAHGWSVAQERSASDLSLDFVQPELVLAARVYGLGPAEAAQAARLAISGPGQLAAMASTVDRTFVQAMAIAAGRREERRDGAFAGPGLSTSADAAMPTQAGRAAAIATAFPMANGEIAAAIGPAPRAFEAPASSAAFGVERRAPRGAFLWPAASVAALGMTAASHDGQQSTSVAALELLAAQAVAEIGTFAALSDRTGGFAAQSIDDLPSTGAAAAATRAAGSNLRDLPSVDGAPATAATPSLAEPGEAEVLGAAAALVPSTRRARFDALYVALSQSPSGRTWSPAARAARALALAGRGEEAPLSAHERAATAWDVLPVVYATDGMSIAEIDAATASGALPRAASAAARSAGLRDGRVSDLPTVDGRPGMTGLTTRAGEALRSYVAPSTGELASAASRSDSIAPPARERELAVAHRAPTAAQELVRTGRRQETHGGGDVEIPAWFDAAARRMFADRAGTGTTGDGGFSMAELTLVNAAPATQIAASTKVAHATAVAPAVSTSGEKASAGAPIDIEKIANEVYREIIVLMDAARARNGEPYL